MNTISLNPYFNGFTILTPSCLGRKSSLSTSLNPYFNGFTILTFRSIT